MRVLAFRHVPFEDLGLIAGALERRNIRFDYADLFREPSGAPSLDGYAALISMGGPMSANDASPPLQAEVGLIRQAIAAGKPVLGICLGSQLIARALGARVYRNHHKEIGWFPLRFTEAARRDPLFSGLTGPETVFHWHGETFDLPDGAEWLASSDLCRHQAFRYDAGTYGLQFHLEVTPEMIADWIRQDGNAGDVGELTHLIDPYANASRLRELAETVFGRWAEQLSRP